MTCCTDKMNCCETEEMKACLEAMGCESLDNCSCDDKCLEMMKECCKE